MALHCDKCKNLSRVNVTRYTLDMTCAFASALEVKQTTRLLTKDLCDECAGPYKGNTEIAKKLIEEIE